MAADPQLQDWAQRLAHLGPVEGLRWVGELSRTAVGETPQGRITVKEMSAERDPEAFASLFAPAASHPLPAPRWRGHGRGTRDWLSVFAFEEGEGIGLAWSPWWEQALDLLVVLRSWPGALPPWDIQALWLERLTAATSRRSPAGEVLARLRPVSPRGCAALAHGDFAPQNIIVGKNGPVLIDWEEAGRAAAGFDAGWLLALRCIGCGVDLSYDRLTGELYARGFERDALRWFEGLGLARLAWRVLALPLGPVVRVRLYQAIEPALQAWLDER
jgi:hypothetical protein